MQQIDTERLKAQHDIIEVITKVVPLKKKGKDYSACCPFHSEKSPSFTVSQSKQVYYCFGCGEKGSVIDFTMNYYGLEFVDACEQLGAQIERMPAKKVQQNIEARKNIVSYSVPIDHCQNIDESTDFYSKCEKINGVLKCPDGLPHLPVINFQKQLVNIAHLGNKITFLAGGLSYGAFHFINMHSKNNIAVVDYDLGKQLAIRYNINVFIVFSEHNLKYVCDIAKPDHLKIKPVLVAGQDDLIAEDMPCLFWDGEKLSKYELESER